MKLRTKHIILTVSLFSAVFLPNSAFAKPQEGCLKLKELRPEYNAVAKGTRMILQLKLKTHDCHLPASSLPSTVSLTAATESGFEMKADNWSYNKIKTRQNFGYPTADELQLVAVATIAGELAPGTYEIPAVLNYPTINEKGDLLQESTALVIPVKVVASVAQVHSVERPDRLKPLKVTGMVVAVIVLFPVFVALAFVQAITGISILSDC